MFTPQKLFLAAHFVLLLLSKPMDIPIPNPNSAFGDFAGNLDPWSPQFQVPDYLMHDDYGFREDLSLMSLASPEKVSGGSTDQSSGASPTSSDSNMILKDGLGKNRVEVGHKVAFRMKSDLEVIDDGYKWRKYGKKSVKNNPNPRNYYKCSMGGCHVKKRIQRDTEDESYVITTYEGKHNHKSPCAFYRNQMLPSLHIINNNSSFFP